MRTIAVAESQKSGAPAEAVIVPDRRLRAVGLRAGARRSSAQMSHSGAECVPRGRPTQSASLLCHHEVTIMPWTTGLPDYRTTGLLDGPVASVSAPGWQHWPPGLRSKGHEDSIASRAHLRRRQSPQGSRKLRRPGDDSNSLFCDALKWRMAGWCGTVGTRVMRWRKVPPLLTVMARHYTNCRGPFPHRAGTYRARPRRGSNRRLRYHSPVRDCPR